MEQRTKSATMEWILRAMPVMIFAAGCIIDAVFNGTIQGTMADRFLPEICGLTVGVLTVLTFAKRRSAYLAAGAVFIVVEMIAITLALPLALRAGLCALSLAMAAVCFAVYVRGPWVVRQIRYAEERVRP